MWSAGNIIGTKDIQKRGSVMKDKYLIFMDVSGDISPEFAKANDVKFLPMEYSIGNEMRKCESMEDGEILKKFYDGQRNGDLTRTTQISPYMYEEFMEPYFEEGYSAIYICLSSGLSSTYNSACSAAEALKQRYPEQDFLPVDSLGATGGMGGNCGKSSQKQGKRAKH